MAASPTPRIDRASTTHQHASTAHRLRIDRSNGGIWGVRVPPHTHTPPPPLLLLPCIDRAPTAHRPCIDHSPTCIDRAPIDVLRHARALTTWPYMTSSDQFLARNVLHVWCGGRDDGGREAKGGAKERATEDVACWTRAQTRTRTRGRTKGKNEGKRSVGEGGGASDAA